MALYRYLLVSVIVSQRYLAPVLAFFVALWVGTSSDKGPLLSAYSYNVMIILIGSTWLTVAVVNHQDTVQRQVVVVAAGGARRVLAATVAVALTGSLLMIGLGLGYPIASGRHLVTAGEVAAGGVAGLAAAFTGIAVGLLTSRMVIRRLGWALLIAVCALLVLLLIRPLPPIGPLIKLLYGQTSPSRIMAEVAAFTGLAAALLIVSAAVTQFVADRWG
jgi:hypothetical protein